MDRWASRRFTARVVNKVYALATAAARHIPWAWRREIETYARIEASLHGPRCVVDVPPRWYLPPTLFTVQQAIGLSSDYRVLFLEALSDADQGELGRLELCERHIRKNCPVLGDPIGFQIDAIRLRRIQATCPWSGRTLLSDRSVIAAARQPIYYRFIGGVTGGRVFYLAVGREGTGYNKLYLYIPDLQTILFLGSPELWNGRSEIDQIRAFLIVHWLKYLDYFERRDRPRVCALVDSSHFAHHLWEDVTGIAGVVEEGVVGDLDKIIVAAEPLMPFNVLFSNIEGDLIERKCYPGLIDQALSDNHFLIRIGQLRIDNSVIGRIACSARRCASASALEQVDVIREKYWPVLWVTVRANNRTWISQETGIAAIANALALEYSRICLIIDGFCIPYDLTPDMREQVDRLVVRDLKSVAEIRARVGPKIMVYSTVGRSMAESLVYAGIADCYFAHHGSLQHKVAWMRNCPGLVHSNAGILTPPLDRHRGVFARVDAVLPLYLDPSCVVDQEGAEPVPNNRWAFDLNNYEMDYCHALSAIREILGSIESAKSLRGF